MKAMIEFKKKPVKNFMNKSVAVISSGATVYEAVQKMCGLKIGAVVIIEDDVPTGIFTERDLAYKVVAKNLDYHKTFLKNVMTKRLTTILPDATIQEAILLSATKNIRHLPVVDEKNKLIGLVGTKDVIGELLSNFLPL